MKYPKLRFCDTPSTSSQCVFGLRCTDTSSDIKFPINDYKFLKKITVGSASVIHLATDKNNNKVIIKVIPKKYLWRNELSVLKKMINSEKTVKLLDFFESQYFTYIVTEYYSGLDLFEHVEINTPYTEENGLKLFLEMCKCVKECHDRNVFHLDIKCENFMVNNEKLFENDKVNVKLIDFGHSEISEKNKLREGCTYGTDYYLCPEAHQRIFSDKSDIWSLGICLSIILTGQYPFDGRRKDYIYNTMKNNINFRNVSKNVENILRKCLDPNPYKRPSIEELIKLVENSKKINNSKINE